MFNVDDEFLIRLESSVMDLLNLGKNSIVDLIINLGMKFSAGEIFTAEMCADSLRIQSLPKVVIIQDLLKDCTLWMSYIIKEFPECPVKMNLVLLTLILMIDEGIPIDELDEGCRTYLTELLNCSESSIIEGLKVRLEYLNYDKDTNDYRGHLVDLIVNRTHKRGDLMKTIKLNLNLPIRLKMANISSIWFRFNYSDSELDFMDLRARLFLNSSNDFNTYKMEVNKLFTKEYYLANLELTKLVRRNSECINLTKLVKGTELENSIVYGSILFKLVSIRFRRKYKYMEEIVK